MSGVDIAGLVEELRQALYTRKGERSALPDRAADALLAQAADLAEARGLIDRLRLEAQIHAGEARCHKATVHEAYQACSGATGEPGNWHGAEPIRKALSEATRQRDEALAALKGAEVAVKPLEWTEECRNGSYVRYVARTMIGGYTASTEFAVPTANGMRTVLPTWHGPFSNGATEVANLEAAKSAAQSDYETRIRSALVSGSVAAGHAVSEAPASSMAPGHSGSREDGDG